MTAEQRPIIVLKRHVADVPSVVTDTLYGMRPPAGTWRTWGTAPLPTR